MSFIVAGVEKLLESVQLLTYEVYWSSHFMLFGFLFSYQEKFQKSGIRLKILAFL
jgi:hypothetical protein